MASPGSQRLKFSQVYQPQRSDSLHYWDYLLVYSVLGTFPNPPYSNQKSRELFSFHTIFHETTLVKENYTAFLTGSVYARVLPHSGRAAKRSSTVLSDQGLWLRPYLTLFLLRGELCGWKPYCTIRAANTDRRKHVTMRHPHQMGVMATHLFPTSRTSMCVPQ